jgi:hypothetical protein
MSTNSRPASPRAAHLALSLAAGACVVAIAYAFTRLVQAWVYPSPDPRTVTHVAHVAFYWRLTQSAWVGGLGAIGASALFARAPTRTERALPALALATALAITLQGVLVP